MNSEVSEGWTYIIVHGCSSEEEDACIVRILDLVDDRAIGERIGAVIDHESIVNETNRCHPIIRLFSGRSIRSIACEASKPSSNVEVAPIGDGVLVVVPIQKLVRLPSHTSPTYVVEFLLLSVMYLCRD